MTREEEYMNRCITLALNGSGNVAPNPAVGCVIVYNNLIIGEAYHHKCGEPHAEVNAINSVKNKELLPKSELYVSLEPCAHFGRTPPCADLIIKMKIPKVFVGSVDPFSKVSGKGIEKLQNAGIEVVTGILKEQCDYVNRRFFCSCVKNRPYVILKRAQTIDGFIDPIRTADIKGSVKISDDFLQIISHKMRTVESSILVGTNTIINDNPTLTARKYCGNNPLRAVIDRDLKLNPGYNVFNAEAPTVVFASLNVDQSKFAKYPPAVKFILIDFDKNVPAQILDNLQQLKIQSVIVEGGTKTHQSFVDASLWDEAVIFMGKKIFSTGVKAFDFPMQVTTLDEEYFIRVFPK